MSSLKIFVLVLIFVFAFFTNTSLGQDGRVQGRMLGGQQADTIKRFAYHVNIQIINNNGIEVGTSCSGSILSSQLILTSAKCVNQGDRLVINFEKLFQNSTAGSYGVLVNNNKDSVIVYPTHYDEVDDIAVVKLPVALQFSNNLQPISISSKLPSEMVNELAVVAGFDSGNLQYQLTYSMLRIVPNDVCEQYYNPFDEYLNMCTKSFRNFRNTPCYTDSGSGLVIGWRARPELVGIYSMKNYNCDNYSNSPSAFVALAKYKDWIDSIMSEMQPLTTTAAPIITPYYPTGTTYYTDTTYYTSTPYYPSTTDETTTTYEPSTTTSYYTST